MMAVAGDSVVVRFFFWAVRQMHWDHSPLYHHGWMPSRRQLAVAPVTRRPTAALSAERVKSANASPDGLLIAVRIIGHKRPRLPEFQAPRTTALQVASCSVAASTCPTARRQGTSACISIALDKVDNRVASCGRSVITFRSNFPRSAPYYSGTCSRTQLVCLCVEMPSTPSYFMRDLIVTSSARPAPLSSAGAAISLVTSQRSLFLNR